MSRLTENERRLGPLTWGPTGGWRPLRLVFSTGGDDDDTARNTLTAYAFGWCARVYLPTRLKPWRRWVKTGHYEWAKSPDSGYWEVRAREYGFSLSDGFLQVLFGPQTDDSVTTKSWCTHLPWTQWRHIRTSQYDDKGAHYFTEWSRPRGFKRRDNWEAVYETRKRCPSVDFEFDDYDGKRITAKTTIEERHYKFGDGWFKWLSLFRRDMVRRSLNLEFSEEVGPEKGSWKGGTTGHGIEMLPCEDHEAAFRRYCEEEHRSKHQRFRITFVGRSEPRAQ